LLPLKKKKKFTLLFKKIIMLNLDKKIFFFIYFVFLKNKYVNNIEIIAAIKKITKEIDISDLNYKKEWDILFNN